MRSSMLVVFTVSLLETAPLPASSYRRVVFRVSFRYRQHVAQMLGMAKSKSLAPGSTQMTVSSDYDNERSSQSYSEKQAALASKFSADSRESSCTSVSSLVCANNVHAMVVLCEPYLQHFLNLWDFFCVALLWFSHYLPSSCCKNQIVFIFIA